MNDESLPRTDRVVTWIPDGAVVSLEASMPVLRGGDSASMENRSEPRMDPNKVKKNGKIIYSRTITSEPAPVEDSSEKNPHWIIATVRLYSRPFTV